ncbi:putative membrane protein [Nocardia farcinica]|uniref:Inner membrane protein yidH n=1 Tax=Nocardia farcinica TaxID=37329 RepID=A0A0H5NDL8_NOCFR|nr:DUF202 domain-containing protein [Nocardia farcinica]PFX04235.1 Inner membrane protein YidH [Nocardia farcinica]PFX06553.1 Inner membrane protein YidH [Nocardia farcinica]CRY73237.1 Inner membrane protein yidH [Nocardia farcinica]SIT29105.1 putative membrane protein [Nocardia farcinica]
MVANAQPSNSRRFPRRVYSRGTEPDARFSLANERTYLAWIRTSLALMAAGVALYVFDVGRGSTAGAVAAALLVGCSVVLPIQAWAAWARTERSLREGAPLPAPHLAAPLAVAVVAASGMVLWSMLA